MSDRHTGVAVEAQLTARQAMSQPVHGGAHALSAFRALPSGEGRQYTATTFPRDPRGGCVQFIRRALLFGWLVRPTADDAYAVLDVLNENGDIVDDYGLTQDGFRWFKRKLNLTVEGFDA